MQAHTQRDSGAEKETITHIHACPRADKENQALVLRAETLEQKMQWLGRLRAASEPVRRALTKVDTKLGQSL